MSPTRQPAKSFDKQFAEVIRIINNARYNAIKSVNAELVQLYWNIGEYISRKLASSEWGDAVVDGLAEYIQENHPEFKGFTRRGLFRMRQFYEAYRSDRIVSPLVTQISWTNHLMILSKTKSPEEKEFYIRLSVKENYSKRELERQIDMGIILCKSKDDEVVEYALSRNLSPALVAEYKTKLIPKKILQKKLHEYYLLSEAESEREQ